MRRTAFITIMILSLASVGCAQRDSLDYTVEFRFKALGFVIVEDLWPSAVALGVEIPISNEFGLVADIAHARWKNEGEVYDDTTYTSYKEYAQRDRRNFICLEARHYFYQNRKKAVRCYAHLYNKTGLRRLDTEDLYPYDRGDMVQLKSHYTEGGFGAGIKFGRKLPTDFCMGVGLRRELIDHVEYYRGSHYREFQNNVLSVLPTFLIRLNFSIPVHS